MKTQIVKALLMVGLVTQMACESKKSEGLDAGSKKQVYINASMTADQLVEAGEQLITPTQFMNADLVFDMALQQDPNNFKALFYKKLLASFMVNKGILARVKPLVVKHGNIKEFEKTVNGLPDMPLTRFLLDGKEDMKSVTDVQSHLSNYQTALNDFRRFLIENQEQQLTIEISSTHIENLLKQGDGFECTQISAADGNYHFECDIRDIAKRKLSMADFMAIRQMLAGSVLFLNFYTAYSFEGIEALSALNIKEGTPSDQVANLVSEKFPQLGKLRSQNLLKETVSLGSDLVSAGRWAITYQNKLCPKGIETPNQRKGYVFHKGICVTNSDEALRSLAVLEQALSSTMNLKIVPNQPEFEIDYLAWFKNPVQDLVSLAPKTTNSCGEATSLRDNTLGGLFVNGDAEKALIVSSHCK